MADIEKKLVENRYAVEEYAKKRDAFIVRSLFC